MSVHDSHERRDVLGLAPAVAPSARAAPGKRTQTEALPTHGQCEGAALRGLAHEEDLDRAGDWAADESLMVAMGLGVTGLEAAPTNGSCSRGQPSAVQLSAKTPTAPAQQQPRGAANHPRTSEGTPGAALRAGAEVGITPPVAAIGRVGFIDNSDGANVRTGPAEAGGKRVRSTPLPPAAQVFVSGVHPASSQWWYVTAFLDAEVVRGYVQGFRVTTDLPEPTAKLYQIREGDTAEKLAVREYAASVRDGHDLRYYENVLLKVNRERGRAGIHGTFQAPGLFGGGANNIQLTAGRRIWLVNPAYARALEGEVPDGSLSNGAYAKAARFAGHVQDLVRSVTRSPQHVAEVAGPFAASLAEHLPELLGITAAFLAAEAVSLAAAASPTGAGQLLAFLIQTLLATVGAAGLVEAGAAALEHGAQWMRAAWRAAGDEAKIAEASREFLQMLLALLLAALAYTGAKGNASKAASILADNIGRALPATVLAVVGVHASTAGVRAPLHPASAGPAGASAGAMSEQHRPRGDRAAAGTAPAEPTSSGSVEPPEHAGAHAHRGHKSTAHADEPTPHASEPHATRATPSWHSGAQRGEAPSAESIRGETVEMELHPNYEARLAHARAKGFEITSTPADPHVEVLEVVDPTGATLELRRTLVLQPKMRFLDLEHEMGHIEQLERLGFPPTKRKVRSNTKPETYAKGNLAEGILTAKQNTIVEYHNRLREFVRLLPIANTATLESELSGIEIWRVAAEQKGGLGRIDSTTTAWAKHFLRDIPSLEKTIREAGYPLRPRTPRWTP